MEVDSRYVVAEIKRTVDSFNARLMDRDAQRVYEASGVNVQSVLSFVNGVGHMTMYLGERTIKDIDPTRLGALENTGLRQVDAQPWKRYLDVLSTKLRNCLLFALHSQILIYIFVADSSVVLSAYKSTVVKALQGLADNTVSKAELMSILERIHAATPIDSKNPEFEKLKAAVRAEEFEATARENLMRRMGTADVRPRSFGGGILDFWKSASPEIAPVVTVDTKFNEVKNLVAIVNQAPNLAKPFLTQYALAYKTHRDSADDLIRTIAGINQQFKAIMGQVSQMLAEMGAGTVSRAEIEAVIRRYPKMDKAVEELHALVEQKRGSHMTEFTNRVEGANKMLWAHMNEVVTASTVALEKRYNGDVEVTSRAVDNALTHEVESMRVDAEAAATKAVTAAATTAAKTAPLAASESKKERSQTGLHGKQPGTVERTATQRNGNSNPEAAKPSTGTMARRPPTPGSNSGTVERSAPTSGSQPVTAAKPSTAPPATEPAKAATALLAPGDTNKREQKDKPATN
jgi:hypothetical protein